jgi:hypothetical protein
VEIIETQNILLHQHNSPFDFLALTITTLQLFTPITVTSNGIDNVLKHLSLSLSCLLCYKESKDKSLLVASYGEREGYDYGGIYFMAVIVFYSFFI